MLSEFPMNHAQQSASCQFHPVCTLCPGEFRDHFCAQLDNAQTGIRATLRRLMSVLQHHDYELWQHIEVHCKVGEGGGEVQNYWQTTIFMKGMLAR